MRVAVIGAGIAGLGAAHALRRVHEVEVFERAERPGGHANTVVVPRPGGGEVPLDTGFLVHNEHNYPLLTRLFRELGVAVQDSEMSFAVTCRRHRLQYSGRHIWRQPRTLVTPGFARLGVEIAHFLRNGRRALEEHHARSTLGDYVAREGYSTAFRDHFIVPFSSALWSTAPGQILAFPASYAVRFFQNHGFLGRRRFKWRTVVGGSRTYVAAITAPLGGRLHLNAPVRAVVRDADGVEVRTDDDVARRFDAVVIAAHAPQALRMLGDGADDLERSIIGAFRTTRNSTVLHTDGTLLPGRARSRGSWNYAVDDCRSPAGEPTVTYYLNKLQRIDCGEHYCVSLNCDDRIDARRVLRRIEYEHPMYTFEALAAQGRMGELAGRRRTWFAGAYQGFGFHEDGLASGLRAAAGLGAPW